MSLDPFDLINPPQRQVPEEPEKEDPFEINRQIFHSHIRHRPDDTSYHRSIAVEVCRFDSQGQHVQMAENCPHFSPVDEEGQRVRNEWTVQSNRNTEC